MHPAAIEIRITWHDQRTRAPRSYSGPTPVTIGRDTDNTIVLSNLYIARRHACLSYEAGQLVVANTSSLAGVRVNDALVERAALQPGDSLAVGPFCFSVARHDAGPAVRYELKAAEPIALAQLVEPGEFPPACFAQAEVPLWALRRSGLPIDEIDYLTIGGALGSLAWVEGLYGAGVRPGRIAALGLDPKPYGRYERMFCSGQLAGPSLRPQPAPPRLRLPLRRSWRDLVAGEASDAASLARELFGAQVAPGAPNPRAAALFAEVERTAARLGWSQIWRYGRVKALRKTSDGRYVVAYTGDEQGATGRHRLLVARFVQLAVGFPGLRPLPDLTIDGAFLATEAARGELIADLVARYRLDLATDGRLYVNGDREPPGLRNRPGRLVVEGAVIR